MASCERNRKISAYHDGELPAEECRELEEHIRQCSSCAQELGRLRSLSGFFAAAEMPRVPSDALDRLHGAVGTVKDVTVLRLAERLMAAAAVLLVVCAVWFWRTGTAKETGIGWLQDWEIAAVSVQAPAEASSDEMLTRWIVSDLSRENGSD